MARRNLTLIPLAALAVAVLIAAPAAGSQDDWNCRVEAYWGALGGSPQDEVNWFGVKPGATDGYDLGFDTLKPGEPFGPYLYTWFEHPSWARRRIAADWRAPLAEGTTKQWGIDPALPHLPPTDYWAVKTNLNLDENGCPDPCGFGTSYPMAASIYISWQFGFTYGPPPGPVPPDDYTFVIKYMGGLNAKPAGCMEPGVALPAKGTTWDMEATPYIVVPVWSIEFQPFTADCTGLTIPDTAKFFFIATNPAAGPTCTIAVDPDSPQEPGATFAFTAAATGDGPLTFSWDFGDGDGDTDNPVSHAYDSAATYTVTCTVTDVTGATGACTTEVEVAEGANHPPMCCFTYAATPDYYQMLEFTDCSTDPDPGQSVVSWSWDFGDDNGSIERNPTHWLHDGEYTVCLTVTDDGEPPLSATCCQSVDICGGGTIDTVAGSGDWGYSGDGGPATEASLDGPAGVTVGADGSLYIADTGNHRIRRVDPAGIITTVAGNGEWGYSGDGGPAVEASLNGPQDVVLDDDGSVYIADTLSHRVRKVDRAGAITTVAGNGAPGYSGDGRRATKASLNYPEGIALGPDDSLYIADAGNHRIRRVARTGVITTVAGNGVPEYSGDGGPALEAGLRVPGDVEVAGDGSLYIADAGNCRIRKVDPSGRITTVAGIGGCPHSGDGGPAIEACIVVPHGIALGPEGTLYVASNMANRVRRVDAAGIIATVAGNGDFGYAGDGGAATRAMLWFPWDVAVGPDGSLYIADRKNDRIRKVWWGPYSMAHCEPSSVEPGDLVAFHANAYNPCGGAVTCQWDFGDGTGAGGRDVTHVYATCGQFDACVTATDEGGRSHTSCVRVTVAFPCDCDVAIDRAHSKMPAAGGVGACKTGQIGARNRSLTESCDVVLRLTDNTGNVVFETARTIGPGRRLRVRFDHCYTADEAGRNRWRWEVWPVGCNERTPRNNVLRRNVHVRP